MKSLSAIDFTLILCNRNALVPGAGRIDSGEVRKTILAAQASTVIYLVIDNRATPDSPIARNADLAHHGWRDTLTRANPAAPDFE